jgi:hypothetical protein
MHLYVYTIDLFIVNLGLNLFSRDKNISFLYTVGEDGQIKIWSKTGMLRSMLAQQGRLYN